MSIRLDYTADEIRSKSDVVFTHAGDVLVAIEDTSKTNVFVALGYLDNQMTNALNPFCFLFDVSPDADVRDAAQEVKTRWEKFGTDKWSREKLYVQCKAAVVPADESTPEILKLAKSIMLSFRNSGMDLTAEERVEIKRVKDEITDLIKQFDKNLADTTDELEVSAQELSSMDDAFLERTAIKGKAGLHKLTTNYPDYVPVIEHCDNELTRMNASHLGDRKCKDVNMPILAELVALRR